MRDEQTGPSVVEFASFSLEEEIASSPRGKLYRAKLEGRTLALKIFDRGVEIDRAALARFRRGSSDQIRHPNLPALEEIGDEDGHPFYAMPFLWGDSLRTIVDDLREGSTDQPSICPLAVGPEGDAHPAYFYHAARLVAEVAEGLEQAHAAGFAHNRLSLRNLIFSPAGRLVVTDFGGSVSHDDPSSLPYTAPEQLAGMGEGVGGRSDVYSLGAILYELVTLRPPFERDTNEKLAAAILKGKCPRPGSLREDLPIALEDCILQALSPRAEQRYSSAMSFAADLRRFMRGELPLARNLRTLKEKILTRDEPSFSFPTRVAVALVLTALLSISIFTGVRLQLSRKVEEAAIGALDCLDRQEYNEAIQTTDRLTSMNPAQSSARVIHDIVKRTAHSEEASSHLVRALEALLRNQKQSALDAVRKAKKLLPDETTMAAFETELRQAAARDPLQAELNHPRETLRVAALEVLRDDLSTGRRPTGDVRLARPALLDPDREVRRSAFAVFAAANKSGSLLEALGVAADEPRCDLDGSTFLDLHATLRKIGDEPSQRLLAAWPLSLMRKLDRTSPPAALDLTPNLRVSVDPAAAGHFARSWIAAAPDVDPDTLQSQALNLVKRPELVSDTVEALSTIGDPRSAETISVIARRHYTHHGLAAIAALERMQAIPALSALLHGAAMPLPYREACLTALGRSSRDDATSVLETVFTCDPEPRLRRQAFASLSRRDPNTWDPTPMILNALEDRELRDDALDWITRLDDERRSRLGVITLSHPDAEIRRHASAILAEDTSLGRLALLSLKALHPSGHVRRAALETIAARGDVLRGQRYVRELLDGLTEPTRAAVDRVQRIMDEGRAWSARLESIASQALSRIVLTPKKSTPSQTENSEEKPYNRPHD